MQRRPAQEVPFQQFCDYFPQAASLSLVSMEPYLIKVWPYIAVEADSVAVDPVKINNMATQCGYAVAPAACTTDALEFVTGQASNFNTTFYKEWSQVKTIKEQQQIILQLVHYMSTYGTDFTGPTFTMNPDASKWHFNSLKVIEACTPAELFERIKNLIKRPVALSKELVNALIRQLGEYYRKYGWRIDIPEVKNREVATGLYTIYGTLPSEPDEIVRVLVYTATGLTQVIKNAKTLEAIENSDCTEAIAKAIMLAEPRIEELASVFYRYKPVFLALRKAVRSSPNGQKCIGIINRISHLAPKYKKPLRPTPLQAVIRPEFSRAEIVEALNREENPFRLIRLYNYLAYMEPGEGLYTYIIRNGKVFVKLRSVDSATAARAAELKNVVLTRIISLVRNNIGMDGAKTFTVAYPDNIELAAPMSEKMFIGNWPYGSQYKLLENSYIGIYWRNEWGTRDFDLWVVGADGKRIGWAEDHKSEGILFSGDMTNADPEATEVMYFRDSVPDCTVRVNRYNGEEGSKFRLFFGTEEISTLPSGYMVPPESIRLVEDLISDNREKTVAVIKDNVAYFSGITTGNGMVPGCMVDYEHALALKLSGFVSLRTVLEAAGVKEYRPECGDGPDIDLRNPDRDSLLKLFIKD